ncbi:hypothetical protein [Candidatus Contubernalis alkaliaceticus]|uniref:hypothetical protein n=1 Tax=Candidatus Contubernalis alkaliaceticus TaxID=338645 RepID=UPI001F4C47BB|nr:hypothetical protein [Candidatus Contubernalis alkalaceticus]UNC93507.1 hypothetical protein HUE98_16335 [Candidatus Contubernalis alkalaceticus]
MEVRFKNNKIKKQCEDPRRAQKDYGLRMGVLLTQRVGELIAATSLLDIKYILSARLHELEGTRANEYSVDLVHPYRLVFTPITEGDVKVNELQSIHIVRIEEVTDYHGKQKRR